VVALETAHVPESAVAKILLICHAQCPVLATAQVVLEMVRRVRENGVVSISH